MATKTPLTLRNLPTWIDCDRLADDVLDFQRTAALHGEYVTYPMAFATVIDLELSTR